MIIAVVSEIFKSAHQAGLPDRAFWVWQYLKHVARQSRGYISEQALKEALKGLNISKTSLYAWLNSAVRIGLLTPELGRTGVIYYRIASWAEGAVIAGCKRAGKTTTMPLDKYLSKNWKSHMDAAYELQLRGRDEKLIIPKRDKVTGEATVKVIERKAKPISRKTLTELTGISRSTQQRREKKAGVKQVENYLIIQQSGVGYQPYGHDKEQPGHHAWWGEERLRLPNSKAIPDDIKISYSSSRTRKINRALKVLRNSDATAQSESYKRLYVDSFDHAMALHCSDVMYPTGRQAPTNEGDPIKQSWRRLFHES